MRKILVFTKYRSLKCKTVQPHIEVPFFLIHILRILFFHNVVRHLFSCCCLLHHLFDIFVKCCDVKSRPRMLFIVKTTVHTPELWGTHEEKPGCYSKNKHGVPPSFASRTIIHTPTR